MSRECSTKGKEEFKKGISTHWLKYIGWEKINRVSIDRVLHNIVSFSEKSERLGRFSLKGRCVSSLKNYATSSFLMEPAVQVSVIRKQK